MRIKSPSHQFANSPNRPTAVLVSGGLDSMVLLADEAARGDVQPIYVSSGLAWEAAERDVIARWLAHGAGRARPLVSLAVDMRDVYAATHWAIQGRPPAYHTPDEDVYLPGRNIVLLGKAAVYCAAAGIDRLVHRHARAQPVSGRDAGIPRRNGRRAVARPGAPADDRRAVCGTGQGRRHPPRRRARRPVRADPVVHESRPPRVDALPPQHCGVCSKCRERHDAFVEAGIADPTPTPIRLT